MSKKNVVYKMSNQLKTMLAIGRFKSEEDRRLWKRMMIEAELVEPKRIKLGKEEKETT